MRVEQDDRKDKSELSYPNLSSCFHWYAIWNMGIKKNFMETRSKNTGNRKYQQMPESELHSLADKKEVPFRSSMNKEQLIQALETYEQINSFFSHHKVIDGLH
jgi:hypothetical protein